MYVSSKHKDGLGNKLIMCQINKTICTAQRYCGEKHEYIISERADKSCKYFNK